MSRLLTPLLSYPIFVFRTIIAGLMLVASSQKLHANFAEIPEAPPSMILDYNDVYLRNPAAKKKLEQSLIDFNNETKYSLYVVIFNNTIGIDLNEILPKIREKWLNQKDGMIIAINIDQSQLYLEEIPLVYQEKSKDTLIPRLLPFMQSHIHPECSILAEQARKRHIDGIPLIDFYASGLMQKIRTIINAPEKKLISQQLFFALLTAFVVISALSYFIVLHLRKHSEKKHNDLKFGTIYFFPKVSRLGRMGAIHGSMITQRQYDPKPSENIVNRKNSL